MAAIRCTVSYLWAPVPGVLVPVRHHQWGAALRAFQGVSGRAGAADQAHPAGRILCASCTCPMAV